ncbi:HAD-superfamily hydrolase, subfamily IB [Natrinema pellirubrum DSM 15624]|uniref:phosphoserine phosphatase n=1 Tax=Natrinema pellirubrum (strain DSM 15624 / CIP 106293 / JCM 10476 / NCIMB 786 / 157) TaxID=797303 RepID=L0JGQ7_NATP1|nr:HAD-IB family phosphatase [Natrinema pellirubrum]AGB30038.1 haloacid dehalogenase superfamily protein, subfamily IB, phosphoserine phosphatase [Natrinema pellirubrum DSM 15624]ELY70183.1 HAD-superfamily hydrolase, subfamily IB [Natrinema pellirubrum DSM 15624]
MTVVAFDFDGTLSDSEMTVLLGDRRGVATDMDEITERAMNDEIEYAESLRKRAALLEGLPEAEAEAAFDEVVLREGAADLIAELNDAGVTTAILTGGFERGVAAALEREGVSVDHIVSNRLPMTGGESEATASDSTSGDQPRVLTGAVEGPLIEGTKDDALADLADEVGVDLADTVAVGDGANDLPMLEVAGLAIGFEPKPAVEPHCDTVVSTMAEARETLVADGVLDDE